MKLLARAGKALLTAFPLIAYAASEQLARLDPQNLPWYTWVWVAGLAMVGWFASSAPRLAGWLDEGEQDTAKALWERRLSILGSATASLAAGVLAMLGGLYAGTPNLLNFMAVLLAGYGGDAFLKRKAEQAAAPQPRQP